MTDKNDKPKVGVFLCHCGTNIGGVVNLSDVAEFTKDLESVAYVEENLHSCSTEGIRRIQEAIEEHGLERVVVASCTPRTHQPLFRDAVEEVGLNKYLFQMINIREHNSWVHGFDPEAATDKAKYLIRMGVEKARYLEPHMESEIEITPACLIVGGGVSGMTAALSIANQGFQVYLVEKEDKLGGLVNELHNLLPTEVAAKEFLTPFIREVETNENIKVLKSSTLQHVDGFIGHFNAAIKTPTETLPVEIGTIILATGAEALKPEGYHQYGNNDNIITQLELEKQLLDGTLRVPHQVVMIQCVGALEEKGRTYCSRICCGVALKNAIILKDLNPNARIHLLYRDLQAYGVELERYYREALKKGIKFIKYVRDKAPDVSVEDGNITLKVYDVLLGEDVELDVGLLVLSTPLIKREETVQVAKLLRVPIDSDGFLLEAHPKMRPVDFSSEGIYLCGTAHSPKNIAESITQALAAASHASIPLNKGKMKVDAVTAVVDTDLCIGCGACASACPFEAIDWRPTGQPVVIEAACKGCGVCTVECPVGAMQLKYFKDFQLMPAIRAILKSDGIEEESDEPTVLVFACKWCSYAAADIAGVMRLKYPTNIRIMLVPCTGRVDFRHIFEALEKGADGVVVAGCLKEQCHYIDGNLTAEKRIESAKKVLKVMGIDPDRIHMLFNSAGMPKEFAQFMNDFTGLIKKKGKIERDQVPALASIQSTGEDD